VTAGVGTGAGERDVEVTNRQEAVDARDDLARWMVQADVDCKQGVHVVEVATLGNGFSAADLFFGRLEDYLERAPEVAVFHRAQDAQPDGRVRVVAASVHGIWVLGAKSLGCGMVV
jgi:hypothetical protein